MGGCRCTYRNCNVKSDGKTHMFHYPVFEKLRCHQWLLNAQRLDFLELKVSQLKNRVVCQHHFKEECFMNYKKDKLTFDAVPTENGPFCDPSKFLGLEDSKEFPNLILIEDIENDFDLNDKKSNFSVKYGDFLTNSEFMDSSARYNRNNINLTNETAAININASLCIDNAKTLNAPQNIRLSLPAKNKKKATLQPMLVVPPYSDLSNELKMGKEINLENNISDIQSNLNPPKTNSIIENVCVIPSINIDNITPASNSQLPVKREPKVKILSEKKIQGPITIKGKFEKISPSISLTWPDKNKVKAIVEVEPEITQNTTAVENDNKPSDKLKVLEVLDVEFDPVQARNEQILKDQIKTSSVIVEKIASQPPLKKKFIQTKNKVTPERSAAIERKRKFNMKLKDIIESCLHKLNDPIKSYETSQTPSNCIETSNNCTKPNIVNLSESPRKIVLQQEVQENPQLDLVNNLSSVQDYTISYLEARMKKMESTLLNKIEQNSQKIMNFKKTWTQDSSKVSKKHRELSNKKSVSTQTNVNEHCYKKFLYQEISKYLSPSTSNIIYEELFISKYSRDAVKSPLKRKRKKYI